MKYMLDTNICIYAIKNKPISVIENIKIHDNEGLCISAITLAELRLGVEKSVSKARNEEALFKFLSIFRILHFDDFAALEYGKICAKLQKKGIPIGPFDTLIAAHAKSLSLTLVTNNIREFERVDGIKLEDWSIDN